MNTSRFRFDFSRLTIADLVCIMECAVLPLEEEKSAALATVALFRIAKKVSIDPIEDLPADMINLVIGDFFAEFIKTYPPERLR